MRCVRDVADPPETFSDEHPDPLTPTSTTGLARRVSPPRPCWRSSVGCSLGCSGCSPF